jgi:hypothetical protein
VRLDGRTITWEIRYDDPADDLTSFNPTDWTTFRAGLVAGVCTEKVTRVALNRNYSFVYRLRDHKGAFRKQLDPISVAACANVA